MQIGAMLRATGHWGGCLGLLLLVMIFSSVAQAGVPKIEKVKYEDGDNQLVVKVVNASRYGMVKITSDRSGKVLASLRANKEGKLEQNVRIHGRGFDNKRSVRSTDQLRFRLFEQQRKPEQL